MNRGHNLFLCLLFLLPGCGEDHEAAVDAKVSEEWMQPGMYVDAVEYLEAGGEYDDMEAEKGKPELEDAAILPFFKRLKEQFDFEQYAILVDDADYCWGFVVKLPEDSAGRRKFEAFLETEKEAFPGMILEEWGHDWLSLDFFNEETAQMIREAEAAAAES